MINVNWQEIWIPSTFVNRRSKVVQPDRFSNRFYFFVTICHHLNTVPIFTGFLPTSWRGRTLRDLFAGICFAIRFEKCPVIERVDYCRQIDHHQRPVHLRRSLRSGNIRQQSFFFCSKDSATNFICCFKPS